MKWSDAARAVAAKAALSLLDGGTLCLYDANGTRLAELGFSSPAARGDTLGPLAPDESVAATGTASHVVAHAQDGSPVFDGRVGLMGSGADVEMKFTKMMAGGRAEVESVRFAPGA